MEDKFSVPSSEKRKGPDLIFRLIDILSIVLWAFLIINISVILYAKPQWETFFDRLFKTGVREHWDYGLLCAALFLSLVQFIISLLSLYLNSKRLKRKTDRVRNSIVISIFSSLLIFIILSLVIW